MCFVLESAQVELKSGRVCAPEKGCGSKFKEVDNRDDACCFHPGRGCLQNNHSTDVDSPPPSWEGGH